MACHANGTCLLILGSSTLRGGNIHSIPEGIKVLRLCLTGHYDINISLRVNSDSKTQSYINPTDTHKVTHNKSVLCCLEAPHSPSLHLTL
jgi:hypothetical protein